MIEAQRVLDEADLDVNRYVRLRADNTIKDDLIRPDEADAPEGGEGGEGRSGFTGRLRFLNNLQPGERAIAGHHLAEHIHGTDSEQHYAARVVLEFRVLQRAIREPSNKEFALYLAARLRELVGEWEMSPELRREVQRQRGLRDSIRTRRDEGEETKARMRSLAEDLRKRHRTANTSELARLILSLSPSRDNETPLPSFDRLRHLIKGI